VRKYVAAKVFVDCQQKKGKKKATPFLPATSELGGVEEQGGKKTAHGGVAPREGTCLNSQVVREIEISI